MTAEQDSSTNKSEMNALIWILLFILALLSGVGFFVWAIATQKNEDSREVFIIESKDKVRVGLWMTKYHGKKVGSDYEQFLLTFDLHTTANTGVIQLEQKTYENDYRLFRADENKAWGCSRNRGLLLLDLSQPSVLADQAQILEKHPVLADGFKCMGYKGRVSPDQRGLYLKTASGLFFRVMEDLSIEKSLSVPLENYEITKGTAESSWQFLSLKHSKGKHVHKIGSSYAGDSCTTLLNPQFILELNPSFFTENPHDNKLWVAHQSALYGEHDLLLSYMLENGVAELTHNASELLQKEALTARGIYTKGNQTFIFLSTKAEFRSIPIQVSLFALRTDTKTGQMLEILTYVE